MAKQNGEDQMKALKKLVLVAALASGFSASLGTATNAGYWVRNCTFYGCQDVYVPTCGWYVDAWGRSFYNCW